MRFKCVSNLWRSIISQYPSFSKIHRSRRSPSRAGSFFITHPDSIRCFYATTLPSSCPNLVPHQFFTTTPTASSNSCSSIKYNGATDVVKGLICRYAGNRSFLCNVTTREIKELPFSPDLEKAVSFTYFLGFASTSKEYKLLKLCLMHSAHEVFGCGNYLMSEILTVGKDASWRRSRDLLEQASWRRSRHLLEQAAGGLELGRTSIYINGFLCCWHQSDYTSYTLIVYNFEDESFQEIYSPPKSNGSVCFERDSLLLQFGDRFAVVKGLQRRFVNRENELKIWVLELDKDKQGSYEWINHTIEAPYDFPVRGCSFAGNLPLPTGDQMLLTGLVEFANNMSAVLVYSFNHNEGKFEKLVIGNFPSWSDQVASICWKDDVNKFCVYYYEEDITPLCDLVVGDKELSLTAVSCAKKKEKDEEEE